MDNNIKVVDYSTIDYGNSPADTMKGGELDHPNDYQLLKKECPKTILFNIKCRIYCPYL